MIEKLFEHGGATLYPLIILSVLALAVTLERICYYGRTWSSYPRLLAKIRENLIRSPVGTLSGADFLEKDRRPLAKMARLLIHCQNRCPSIRNDILKREGERILCDAYRYVRFLGLCATIAPLLGLAGTVLGLVSTFMLIESKGGQVNPAELAGGIWEALLTTIAGLAIAIPCMLVYHFFSGRCDSLARDLKNLVSEVDEWLHLHDAPACNQCLENPAREAISRR